MMSSPAKRVHCIAAMDPTRIIGLGPELPWKIPEDLAHFKAMTLGKACIMGRVTWDSIPTIFRPLQGRLNIVITRDPQWIHGIPECAQDIWGTVKIARSITEAIELAGDLEPWIIGGAQIYEAALPYITDLHVTLVERGIPELQALAVSPEIIRFPMCPVKEVAHWELTGSKVLAPQVTYHRFTRRAAPVPL